MEIDRVTLIEPDGSVRLSFTDVVVRSVAPSRQSVVFETPHEVLEGTALGGPPSEVAGYSVVLTTTDDRTYSGYVEVVTDAGSARCYWCGVGL
jgi:hypothetical protein